MNKHIKFLFNKSNKTDSAKNSGSEFPQAPLSVAEIVEARKLLPVYLIPRSEATLSDGRVVKSLFMDYVPDRDYFLSKIIRQSRVNYEKECQKHDCFGDGQSHSQKRLSAPDLPFFGYN